MASFSIPDVAQCHMQQIIEVSVVKGKLLRQDKIDRKSIKIFEESINLCVTKFPSLQAKVF